MSQKKKILFIHESMTGGGAERVLVTLLDAFDYERYDVTLLLISDQGPFYNSVNKKVKVKTVYPGQRTFGRRLVRYNRRVRDFMESKRARKILGDERFDVTVSFMEGTSLRLHGDLLGYAPRNLSWVHTDLSKFRWYDKWLTPKHEKELYDLIDGVAFVSEDALKGFRNVIGERGEQKIIYNPVDRRKIVSEAGQTERGHDGTIKLVTVGRLIDVKNHRLLLDTCKKLTDKKIPYHLTIVGTGILENELKQYASALGLSSQVEFAGFQSNPFPTVAKSDIFCLTSKAEGYSMVLAEALTLGVPVISTDVTGPRELLARGGGVLLDHDAKQFADEIERLAKNPDELSRLKADALKASEQFDITATMEAVHNFIDGGNDPS
ncbi:MAG: glycosyltransferase [Muribaculaceae bacterium]|nr:glycosyltransferase [Muribaculaceae bacterium]